MQCWAPVISPASVTLPPALPPVSRCPAFKLLTYYGSAKERKAKRQGWSKPNAFHVCITSYTLVLQVGVKRGPHSLTLILKLSKYKR